MFSYSSWCWYLCKNMAENGDFLLFGDSHHSVKKEKGRVLLFLGYSLHFKFHCCSSQLPSVLTFGNFVIALSQVEWKSLKQNLHFKIQQRLCHIVIHSRSEYFFFGQKKNFFFFCWTKYFSSLWHCSLFYIINNHLH